MFHSERYNTNTVDGQYTQFIDTLRYAVMFASKKQCEVQDFDTSEDNHIMLYLQMLMDKKHKLKRSPKHNPIP